jgi:hypothetical protein
MQPSAWNTPICENAAASKPSRLQGVGFQEPIAHQRAPPEISTFLPASLVRSRIVTCGCLSCECAHYACMHDVGKQ